MPAPPITIACDCGEMRHVPYGDRWTCESCGKTWNTSQIPVDEYQGLLRDQRRERLLPVGVSLAIFAIFGVLAFLVSESLILLAPIVVAGWLLLFMPFWRARLRRRTRTLPRWQLTPE